MSVPAAHLCSVCGAYVGPTLGPDTHVHASLDPADAPTTAREAAAAAETARARLPPGPAPEPLPPA